MAQVFLMSILLLHLLIVPSMALLPRNWYRFIGFGGREGQQPQPLLQPQPNPLFGEKLPERKKDRLPTPATAAKLGTELREGFYSQSCPNAEKIVGDVLAETFKTNPNAVSNVIRLLFHDCFVGVS